MNFKKYHESKNLLNNTAESTSMPNVTITVNADKTITLNGVLIESIRYITLGYIDFAKGKEYTISGVTGFTDSTLQIFVESNSAFPLGNRLQCYNGAVTRTARASERCIVRLYMYTTVTYNNVVVSPQINEGSTPLPYEPYSSEVWHDIPHYIHQTDTDTLTTLPADIYANDTTATVGLKGNMEQSGTPTPTTPIQPNECGDLETTGEHAGQYKIPISSANTTTPVYLGEVQSTRQIRKWVLNGTENINTDTNLRFSIYVTGIKTSTSRTGRSYCSHYECLYHAEPYDNDWNNVYYQSGGTLYFHDRRFSAVADFKSYLAAQYAAGTPVTIWYVLATPTTGIVNEPLRKIGDYADEVSGITIPTIAGANTISVDTTLQPSEITVNYEGWHSVQSVHERENGSWT